MSIERLCDCPECHGYDGYDAIIGVGGKYAVIGGRDVCERCLTGEWGCDYWQPYTRPWPSQMELLAQNIWDPVIKQQLAWGTLMKDWDKYTENRMKHVTFKIKKERDGSD